MCCWRLLSLSKPAIRTGPVGTSQGLTQQRSTTIWAGLGNLLSWHVNYSYSYSYSYYCLMRWCHGSSCFNTLSIVAHNPTWWTVTQPVHCLLCLSLRYVGVPGSVILLCMVVGSYAMVGIHLHRQIWHCVLFMSFLFQIYGFDLPGTWHNLALHCLFFAMHRLVLSGTVLLLPCTGQMEALVSLAFKASILHVPVTYARDIA